MLDPSADAAIEAAVQDVKHGDTIQELYAQFVQALTREVKKTDPSATVLEVARRFLHGQRIGDPNPDGPTGNLKSTVEGLPFSSVREEIQ